MIQNIHIFSEKRSNRLSYVLHEVFERRLSLSPVLHRDQASYESADGIKLNYSNIDLKGVQIRPALLLFERRIDDHDLSPFVEDGILKLFKSTGSFNYDPLAASFYLLTRYEEYLPHRKDEHGRFRAEDSIVVKHDCLHIPLVEQYCEELRMVLGVDASNRTFTELVTFDVDQVFAYKAKGLARTIAGTLKSLVSPSQSFGNRMAVLTGQEADPLDLYEEVINDVSDAGLRSIFFFQVGEASSHDINNPPHLRQVRKRINDVAMRSEIGLHPSYFSSGSLDMLSKEIDRLRRITSMPVSRSRQHYLKFQVPDTFALLKEIGVTEDYSMSYSTMNGFRAGTCMPFAFYDLRTDDRPDLMMYPGTWMDMCAVRDHHREEDAYDELVQLRSTVEKYGGTFISTWHPDSLIGMNIDYATLPLLHRLIGKDEVS